MSALSQQKVLVVNRFQVPINVVTLEDALKKLTGTYKNGQPKAVIVDCLNAHAEWEWDDWRELIPHANACPECRRLLDQDQIEEIKPEYGEPVKVCKDCQVPIGEPGIKCPNAILRIPTVIRLTRYDKLPQAKIKYNRRTIYRRDNNTCQYCGARPGTKELSLDHVIPRAQGGKTVWENIVVACTDCNARKADRTPAQAGMKLLRQPKKPKFNLYSGDIRVKDWETWLGVAYWLTELKNDEE
jgi:5-methylcytosine-specific restriction endonuclease McrA